MGDPIYRCKSDRMPLRFVFPGVKNGLGGAQRGIGARITDIGRARGNCLDDFLLGGTMVQSAADLSCNRVILALGSAHG